MKASFKCSHRALLKAYFQYYVESICGCRHHKVCPVNKGLNAPKETESNIFATKQEENQRHKMHRGGGLKKNMNMNLIQDVGIQIYQNGFLSIAPLSLIAGIFRG